MRPEKRQIGIVVALPEERMALTRRLDQAVRSRLEGLLVYTVTLDNLDIHIVEGGMGFAAATAATHLLLEQYRPSLLISAGFCGAVRLGAKVADLVLCKRLFTLDNSGLMEHTFSGNAQNNVIHTSAMLHQHGLRVWQGSFITAATIVNKSSLASSLPQELATPVLEMETAAVASQAAAAGIPFIGLRSISDDAAEELSFSIDQFVDSRMKISIPRVIKACLLKPAIIPQLFRLAGNSAKAGKSLADAVFLLLTKL